MIPTKSEGVNKEVHVAVIVTLKDIIMYIIIVYCCTPIGDVFPSFWDVTI